MISARHVSAKMPSGADIHDVSVDVRAGECVGLAGPSGSGTRTLLYVLAGFVSPEAGSVHLDGDSSACDSRRLRQAVTYLGDAHLVGRGLRVDEYLELVARARRRSGGTSISEATGRLGLNPVASVDSLGSVQRVALSVACSMVTSSEIVLIALGDDTISQPHREEILGCVTAVTGRKVALMLATEDPSLQRAACDRVITLEQGRLT